MSTIAIVGSRHFPRHEYVKLVVEALPLETIVVSGSAFGVDRIAAREARFRGLYVQELPVHRDSWKSHGRKAGPMRNAFVVRLVDGVIAFWDWKSRGTRSTIQLAVEAGLPVWVISPNGDCYDSTRTQP